MKIVAIGLRGFPDIQGGVETHCEQLYTRIVKEGHEVIVIGRKPYRTRDIRFFEGVRLIWLSCPRSTFLEAVVHTFIGTVAARFLKPDILHIHAIGPSLMAPLARVLGMRVVTTNHGADYERQKWGPVSKAILKLGERFGCRWSRRVIAISQPIADHLKSSYQCDASVIPNGVAVMREADDRHDVLDTFQVTKGRYVLGVGRLVPEKGMHDLIEAFVEARLEGWKLVIVGSADHEGAYSDKLKQKACEFGSIVMTGFLTGVPLHQFYTHAGLFVHASYHEGMPIVMLEALSYSLPVLASDIPANRQVPLAEEFFFPPGDVATLARKIRIAAGCENRGPERARDARNIVRLFDWDLIARSTVAVYEAVLSEGRTSFP